MRLRILNTDPVHFGEFVDAGMATEVAMPAGPSAVRFWPQIRRHVLTFRTIHKIESIVNIDDALKTDSALSIGASVRFAVNISCPETPMRKLGPMKP